MERLTERLEDGQAMLKCTDCRAFGWLRACTALSCRNMLKDRLAEYEDTGLEPSDVKAMYETAREVGAPLWKIKELYEAWKNDSIQRVVRCKDCVFHYYDVDCGGRCKLGIGDALLDEDYCSRGESSPKEG